MNMLRKIRITLAVLFFAAVTALFLDFTGTIHTWLGWTAKIQFLPALLAPYSSYGRIASNLFAPLYRWGNNLLAYLAERADSYAIYETEVWLKSLPTFIIAAVTFIALVALAWRNGRTYCNTICPVGTTLGLFSRFSLFRPVIDSGKCKNCSLVHAAAKPPASTTRAIGLTPAAAWRVWTASTRASTTLCILNLAGRKRTSQSTTRHRKINRSMPPAAVSLPQQPWSPPLRR